MGPTFCGFAEVYVARCQAGWARVGGLQLPRTDGEGLACLSAVGVPCSRGRRPSDRRGICLADGSLGSFAELAVSWPQRGGRVCGCVLRSCGVWARGRLALKSGPCPAPAAALLILCFMTAVLSPGVTRQLGTSLPSWEAWPVGCALDEQGGLLAGGTVQTEQHLRSQPPYRCDARSARPA